MNIRTVRSVWRRYVKKCCPMPGLSWVDCRHQDLRTISWKIFLQSILWCGAMRRSLSAAGPAFVRHRERRGRLGDLSDIPNLTYRQSGAVVENPLAYCAATEDLDQLKLCGYRFYAASTKSILCMNISSPISRRHERQWIKRYFKGRWIATARGCKFECSYCGGCRTAHKTLAGRNGIVPRSPEAVVREIERLAANQVLQVSLSYDIAEMGESYWRKFFSLLRKSGVKIGLYNEFFQMPPAGFLKDFARSVDMEHSVVALSPLSGNERVRRLNGKHYTNAELFNLLDYLNLYNFSIFVYFSLNLPGETEETMAESVDLATAYIQSLSRADVKNPDLVPYTGPPVPHTAASRKIRC